MTYFGAQAGRRGCCARIDAPPMQAGFRKPSLVLGCLDVKAYLPDPVHPEMGRRALLDQPRERPDPLIPSQKKRILLLVASLSASSLADSPAAHLPHPGPATHSAKRSGVAQNALRNRSRPDRSRMADVASSHELQQPRISGFVQREGEKGFASTATLSETTRSGAPSHDEGELGVGCVTCHVPKNASRSPRRARTRRKRRTNSRLGRILRSERKLAAGGGGGGGGGGP